MSGPASHSSRFGVATHESGHAVVFSVLDVPYSSVTIVPGPATFGAASAIPDTAISGRVTGQPAAAHRRALPFVLGLLAGSLAEATITGRDLDDIAQSCGVIDLWLADQLCAGMHPGASNVLIARAGQLVQRHSSAITAVAADLLVYQTLTAAEVAAIVNQYPPAAPTGAAPTTRPGGQP